MDQSLVDDLRQKAKEHREYAEQVDAVAELATKILGARPSISPFTALPQRSKAPVVRKGIAKAKRGGKVTKNGDARQRAASFKRRPRAETRAEVLAVLGTLGPDEWFSPVVEAKKHARISSAKYRYLRSAMQRESKVLLAEGLVEERRGIIPGTHGGRRGGSMLEYRLIKASQ